MGTLPDGVRADAVQMPGTGAQPRRAKEVPLQEQADEPGWKHHRFVGEHVRLGKIPADPRARSNCTCCWTTMAIDAGCSAAAATVLLSRSVGVAGRSISGPAGSGWGARRCAAT